jgi:hypothetical protein
MDDDKFSLPKILQKHLLRITRMTFSGAVRAFEFCTFAQLVERLLSNNMAARHHHRRVLIRALLLGYRAYEDGMEMI